MSSLKSDSNKKIELVFLRQGTKYDMYLPKVKPSNFFGLFTTDIDRIDEWFKQYKVDLIEVWINGIIETEETTRLFVGTTEEDRGLRVILRPMSEMTEGNKNKVD
ncbi:MAG TPA: hypothetical protein VH796_01895 [Nitrososphaeraceae archaeon]|jgi:hypothetical protein